MRRLALALIATAMLAAPAAAQAKNESIGIFRTDASFRLIDRLAEDAGNDYAFPYGSPGDQPVAGDWNGDARDGVGVYRPSNNTWYLTNVVPTGGPAPPVQSIVTFGEANIRPVVGDFDGDGRDDIGYYKPSTSDWRLRRSSGGADIVINDWGIAEDRPIAGDWNGDGRDGIGVYRPSNRAWYLLNTPVSGATNPPSDTLVSNWGNPIDLPVAGDWDGDGRDTIGVFRPNPEGGVAWYFTNTSLASGWINAPGIPISFQYYGGSSDKPVAGDWDGRRPECRDGVDNDEDDQVDWTADFGCAGEFDTPEDGPPSPPARTFSDSFEAAQFPALDWNDGAPIIDPSAADVRVDRVSSSVVPPSHGSYSMRSELLPTGARAEIQCHTPSYGCADGEGSEFTYEFDVRVPSGYTLPGRSSPITQSKPTAPPGTGNCYGGGFQMAQTAGNAARIDLALATNWGEVTSQGGYCGTTGSRVDPLGSYAKDTWHRIKYWVRWSVNPGVGFVEVFVDGVKRLPRRYQPTMLNGAGRVQMFRLGLYESLNPSNYQTNYRAYYDNVLIYQLRMPT